MILLMFVVLSMCRWCLSSDMLLKCSRYFGNCVLGGCCRCKLRFVVRMMVCMGFLIKKLVI